MTGDLAHLPIFAGRSEAHGSVTSGFVAIGSVREPLFAAKGPGKGKPSNDDDGKIGLATKTRPVTKKPSLYKVLLLNDDYTPMEFVIHVLERFFSKGREDATKIMLHVHQKGVGVCGVYTYEVAETKVTQVMDLAKEHQHPLQCRMEKE
jgi:ATP-dependent Clp protease adaptor protein ClpS